MDNTILVAAADHVIKSVTIFKSEKAEVVRTFKLTLEPGQNKVEITGLSSCIDTHSVRVSNLGDARLFDVVCTVDTGAPAVSYDPESKNEIVRILEAKKVVLESEKRTRVRQEELLLSYGKTLGGEHITPAALSQFLQTFAEQSDKNTIAIAELSEKIHQIDRQIEKTLAKTIKIKGESRGKVTVVVVSDDESLVELKLTYIVSNAEWRPTYELHASTEGGKASSSVSLHYRARITQSTGEDWNGTSLTLSTIMSGTSAKTIPQLLPVKIRSRYNTNPYTNPQMQMQQMAQARLQQAQQMQQQAVQQQQIQQMQQIQQQIQQQAVPQPQMQLQQQQFSQMPPPQGMTTVRRSRAAAGSNAIQQSSWAAPESWSVPTELANESDGEFEEILGMVTAPSTGPGAEPTTVVTETPVAISYSVAGKSTIPSDGVDHQVSVAVLPFDAKISYVTSPRVEPVVYLQCQVQNKSEYRLLPGPVSVILDDSYVSKTNIQDINTGDTFTCTLGDDSSVKVTYLRSATTVKSNTGAFTEAFSTTTYSTRVSIHNKHAFAISDLVVREVIPTSEDKQVKVILRKPKGLAETKGAGVEVALGQDGLKVCWQPTVDGGAKGGEKEGKFEWRYKVDAGAKAVLEAEWEVKAPADLQWYESTVGNNNVANVLKKGGV